MAIMRRSAVGLLLLTVMLVLSQATLAASDADTIPDSGQKSYREGERVFYDSEGDGKDEYWITYSRVNFTAVRPGAGNYCSLTIGNLMKSPLNFNILVEQAELGENGTYEPLPEKWITVTEDVGDKADSPGEVKAAEILTIPAAGEGETGVRNWWIQFEIPRNKKYADKQYQCVVKVIKSDDADGAASLIEVHTANELSSGETNIAWVFGVLVFFICLIGAIVYGFSRWMWPNETKDNHEEDRPIRETGKESLSTGLSPADWQE